MTLDPAKLKEAAEKLASEDVRTMVANPATILALIERLESAEGKPSRARVVAAADRMNAVWPELRVIFSRRDLETIAEVALEVPEPERR